VDAVGRGADVRVGGPPGAWSGVALVAGDAWLGAWYADLPSAFADAYRAVCASGDPGEGVALAVRARLPLLGSNIAAPLARRLAGAAPDAVARLLRLAEPPDLAAREHVLSRLLTQWAPSAGEAARLLQTRSEAAEGRGAAPPALHRLLDVAPVSAAVALAAALRGAPARERKAHLVAAMLRQEVVRGLPDDVRGTLSAANPERTACAVRDALLAQACSACRVSDAFLASKSEASVASMAAAFAADLARPAGHRALPPPENLAVALTQAPIRRWLGAHLVTALVL
jgi:hypothetical protein